MFYIHNFPCHENADTVVMFHIVVMTMTPCVIHHANDNNMPIMTPNTQYVCFSTHPTRSARWKMKMIQPKISVSHISKTIRDPLITQASKCKPLRMMKLRGWDDNILSDILDIWCSDSPDHSGRNSPSGWPGPHPQHQGANNNNNKVSPLTLATTGASQHISGCHDRR